MNLLNLHVDDYLEDSSAMSCMKEIGVSSGGSVGGAISLPLHTANGMTTLSTLDQKAVSVVDKSLPQAHQKRSPKSKNPSQDNI